MWNRSKDGYVFRIAVSVVAYPLATVSVFAQETLPSDPSIVAGDISISSTGSTSMDISQSTANGIVNWGSFSIGDGRSVTFRNGDGATLNRVTGNNASQIMGTLDATGSVYLLNQNGVFFGKNGVVRTGGDFIASTLDISNSDFLDGGDTIFGGDSDAVVMNLGEIGSLGGNVALIAREVVNEGSISAPEGTAALVAGREILMRDHALDHGLFAVRIGGEDTSVTDRGSIKAAAAELRANGGNIYALAGNTSGTIAATGVRKKGGRVFLTAGSGRIQASKPISARKSGGQGGQIKVRGGNIVGTNLFDASALAGKGGFVELFATAEMNFSGTILAFGGEGVNTGGFAEVSGKRRLSFDGHVDTGGGTLLLDPDNIEISDSAATLGGASLITPTTLQTSLANNNVVVQTNGTDEEAGTILISSALNYGSDFDLTFLAHGDLLVEASVQNTNDVGGGDINFVAGWDGFSGWGGIEALNAFDTAPFESADLETDTLFGIATGDAYTFPFAEIGSNASGSVFFGDFGNDLQAGSRGGVTRVFGRDLVIDAENAGYAMLGHRVTDGDSGFDVTGDIIVRAVGDIEMRAGNGTQEFVQIGHVGSALGAGETVGANVNGDILVEAEGDITLFTDFTDASLGSYALIGHGSIYDDSDRTFGTRQGDITVLSGGEISLDEQVLPNFESIPDIATSSIGHDTADRSQISNADIVIFASSFDRDSSADVVPNQLGNISNVLIENGLEGGAVSIAAFGSGLTFDSTGIDASNGDLTIQVNDELRFEEGFQLSDDGANSQYVFASDTFTNLTGATAFDLDGGKWFIYSDSPQSDTGGLRVLDAGSIVYDETFDPNDPILSGYAADDGSVLDSTLNTLVYGVDPILVIDSAVFSYGQDSALNADVQLFVGESPVDLSVFGFDNVTVGFDPDVVTFSSDGFVNAGVYSGGLTTTVDDFPAFDSIFYNEDGGELTVDQLGVTVTLADEAYIYDGIGGYSGNVTYSGFIGSDSESLVTSGPIYSYSLGQDNVPIIGEDLPSIGDDAPRGNLVLSEAVNVGTYGVFGSGRLESSGNYIFDETDTAILTIDPAILRVLLADETKSETEGGGYTGTVSYAGFVTGDDASLISSGPLFGYMGGDGSDGVGVGVYTVSASGTLETSGNYTLDESDTASLTIEAFASVGVGIDPEPEVGLPEFPTINNPVVLESQAPKAAVIVDATDGESGADGNGFIEVSTANTDQVVQQLARGRQLCEGLADPEYSIDCMGDSLQKAAESLPDDGDYADVKRTLQEAASKLAELARQNASRSLTRGLVQSNGLQSSRRLTPVATEALAALNAQASEIIDQAETVLLRSAQSSERRQIHYQRIAEAVGSNKILLRS